MEFIISTEAIQKAIKVLSVVTKANAIDATGRILIESTENNTVELVANNGNTSALYTVEDVEIIEPGRLSVGFSNINNFIMSFRIWDGESGSKTMRFKSSEKNITIVVDNIYGNGKKTKAQLKLVSFNPLLITTPKKFEKNDLILNSTIFRNATNKILYAINQKADYGLAALQGMNIQFDENYMYFAGSDGRVLSEYQVNNVSGRLTGNIILHYDFIMGLRRLINDNIKMAIEINDNSISVKFNNIIFTGRLIIGQEFPDYRKTFEQFSKYLNFKKDFLVEALSPFIDVLDAEDNFRITLEIKDKLFKLYNDHANMESEIDIEGGLNISIDVNGRLFLSSIDAIKDEAILIKFSDNNQFIIMDSSTYNDQKAIVSTLRKR
jgi:DNA polymerase III sliding clamp (beta) subunit (PCNA family)